MYCRMNVYRNNEWNESFGCCANNNCSNNGSSNDENGQTVLYRITPVAVNLSEETDNCGTCCNHTWGNVSNCCCDCCCNN